MHRICFFILCFVLTSCKSSEHTNTSFETIHIDLRHNIQDTISIYNMCSSIDLICLQENDSIKINAAGTKYAVNKGNIYILESSSKNLLQFDSTGVYKQTIARRGRGHGEYSMAEDFLINPYTDLIEVLNPIGKIMKYSSKQESAFVSEVDLTHRIPSINEFAIIEPGKYFFYSAGENKYYLYEERSDKLFCIGSILPDWIAPTIWGNGRLFQHKNEIRVFTKMNGTYYTVSNKSNKLVAYLDFDLGRNERSLSSMMPNKDYSYYHRLALLSPRTIRFSNTTSETDKSIIATFTYKGISNFHTIIYNKEKKTYNIFRKTVENVHFLPGIVCGENAYYLIEDPSMFSFLIPSDHPSTNSIDIENNYLIVYQQLKI